MPHSQPSYAAQRRAIAAAGERLFSPFSCALRMAITLKAVSAPLRRWPRYAAATLMPFARQRQSDAAICQRRQAPPRFAATPA
jgi:hypothetical protein